MSDSDHNTEMALLVTLDDARGPYLCKCGRPAPLHDSIVYPYLCPVSPDEVRRRYWEKVVRREIAKELDRLVHLETIDMHANRYDGPEDVIQRAVLADDIAARAQEIRNG